MWKSAAVFFGLMMSVVANGALIEGNYCILNVLDKSTTDALYHGTFPSGIKASKLERVFYSSSTSSAFQNFDGNPKEDSKSFLGYSISMTQVSGEFSLIRRKDGPNHAWIDQTLGTVSLSRTETKMIELDDYFFMVSCFSKDFPQP